MVFAILLEISDKIPSVEFLYLGGLFWGATVLGATIINRWFGLTALLTAITATILLFFYGLDEDLLDAIIEEIGSVYIDHWTYSTLVSLLLAVAGFFCGLKLRVYLLKTLSNLD